jgi:hypothetical protein
MALVELVVVAGARAAIEHPLALQVEERLLNQRFHSLQAQITQLQ